MNDDTRAKLQRVSTATIATALFKRGLRSQMIQGVQPLATLPHSMVGPAFTLRYIPPARTSTASTSSRTPPTPSASPSRNARRATSW